MNTQLEIKLLQREIAALHLQVERLEATVAAETARADALQALIGRMVSAEFAERSEAARPQLPQQAGMVLALIGSDEYSMLIAQLPTSALYDAAAWRRMYAQAAHMRITTAEALMAAAATPESEG